MKKIKMIFSYYRENGFTCVLLMIVLLGTLLISTMVSGRIRYLFLKADTLEAYPVGQMYYLEYFPSDEELYEGIWQGKYTEFSKDIQDSEAVEGLFTVYTAQGLCYEGNQVTVVLYQPEMVEMLLEGSAEQRLFEKDEQGAILAGRMFSGIRAGETLKLDSTKPNHSMEVTVLGHVKYPYSILSLNASSTELNAEQLYTERDVLLLQATEYNLAAISENSTVFESMNMLLCFKENATETQILEVLEQWGQYGTYVSTEEIVQNSRKTALKTLKTETTFPLAMLVFVTISYIAMVIMMVTKKKKELSIMSLCGAGEGLCSWVVVMGNFLIALIPVLVTILFIAFSSELDWNHVINLEGYRLGTLQIIVVIGYLLLTLGISFLGTRKTIQSSTPIALYRELGE